MRYTPVKVRPSGQFHPEPVLPDVQSAQALGVLRNARNALERTPSMTANLDEEKIRDLLLVLLNAQFEGAAAGEVFNAAGKTDILIRAGDRNVFIAECKIWKGPKTIRDALSQTPELPHQAGYQGCAPAVHPDWRADHDHHQVDRGDQGRTTRERTANATTTPCTLNREIQLAFLPFALRDAQA